VLKTESAEEKSSNQGGLTVRLVAELLNPGFLLLLYELNCPTPLLLPCRPSTGLYCPPALPAYTGGRYGSCLPHRLPHVWVGVSAIIRGFIVRFLHQMQLRQNSCHSKSIFDRIVELFHRSFLFECSIQPAHRRGGYFVERKECSTAHDTHYPTLPSAHTQGPPK